MRELEIVGGCHFSGVGSQFCTHAEEWNALLIFQFCIVGNLILFRMTSFPMRLFAGYYI